MWKRETLAVALLVGAMGCGGREVAPGGSPRLTAEPHPSAEPQRFGEGPVAIPEVSDSTTVTSRPRDVDTSLVATADARFIREDGYRVQIYAGHRRDRAEEIADQARERLGLDTYVISTADFFKVHVGDCATRADVDSLVARIRASGYGDAWVVDALIRKNQDTP